MITEQTEQQQKVKQKLFGTVRKAPTGGNHQLDPKKIKAVIKVGAAIGCFCAGCGYTQGLTEKGARDVAEWERLELPASLEGVVFITKRCPICDDKFKGVELRKLAA